MTEQAVNVPATSEEINISPDEIAPQQQNGNSNDDHKYTSDTVTKIVKREREKAFEKGKREALMELQQQQTAPDQQVSQQQVAQQQPQQSQSQPSSIGGIPQLSPEQIKQLVMQHAPEALAAHSRQLEHKNVVDSFVNKMKAAESKYPGMEQKLNELDYSTIAPLIKHINQMENSGDIMNELIENPMKMGNLVSLVYSQPKLAEKAIHNLSASIKMNDDAKSAEKSSHDPFNQQKPSLNAGKDDGEMSVSDFQSMFKKKRR
jgi:hypothetical protein